MADIEEEVDRIDDVCTEMLKSMKKLFPNKKKISKKYLDGIREVLEQAHQNGIQEGRKMKGSSWREGYQAGLKEGIQEAIDKLTELVWYHNDEGVKELEDNTDYLDVKEVQQALEQLKS